MSKRLSLVQEKMLSQRMEHFNFFICSAGLACLLLLGYMPTKGQQKKEVETTVAKVLSIDDKDVFDRDFFRKIRDGHIRYYYAILHFKVVSFTGDTLQLAYVFDVKKQTADALNNFYISKDSVYQFDLYDLNPCNGDFPRMIGCLYKESAIESVYLPHKNAVVKQPYKQIKRILDFTLMPQALWDELRRSVGK